MHTETPHQHQVRGSAHLAQVTDHAQISAHTSTEFKELQLRTAQLEAEKLQLDAKVNELTQQLDPAQISAHTSREFEELQLRTAQLEAEKVQLDAKVNELTQQLDPAQISAKANTEFKELQLRTAQLEAENAQLCQRQVAALPSPKISQLEQENSSLRQELNRYKQMPQSSLPTVPAPYDHDRIAELEKANFSILSENNSLKVQQMQQMQQIEQLTTLTSKDGSGEGLASPQVLDQDMQAERAFCWRLFYEVNHLQQDLQLYTRKLAKSDGLARYLNDRLQMSESRNEDLTLRLQKMKVEVEFLHGYQSAWYGN
jgi:DNA-directed RNA polymerase specialized sigma54-like protein